MEQIAIAELPNRKLCIQSIFDAANNGEDTRDVAKKLLDQQMYPWGRRITIFEQATGMIGLWEKKRRAHSGIPSAEQITQTIVSTKFHIDDLFRRSLSETILFCGGRSDSDSTDSDSTNSNQGGHVDPGFNVATHKGNRQDHKEKLKAQADNYRKDNSIARFDK